MDRCEGRGAGTHEVYRVGMGSPGCLFPELSCPLVAAALSLHTGSPASLGGLFPLCKPIPGIPC